jgi:hypothetical protein
LQSDQRTLGVAQISYDLAERLGQFSNQGRDRDDLVTCRQLRVLEQVDDLDSIAARQMLFAELLQVRESRD